MENELISVIIICYNIEKYIGECLESIMNQTYSNIEIIVVNDGSCDNSAQIIKEISKKDKRVKFINRKNNKGTFYTRKEGYKNASGKYVTFVDADDYLEKDAIEVMYKKALETRADIIKCQFSKLVGNKKLSVSSKNNEDTLYVIDSHNSNFYNYLYNTIELNTMCGLLIKHELLNCMDMVDDSMIYGEDLVNNLYLYDKADTLYWLNRPLYVYRYNPGSITSTVDEKRTEKKIKDTIITYKELYNYVDIYKLQNRDLYHDIAISKIKKYIVNFLIDLCLTCSVSRIKKFYKNIQKDCDFCNISEEKIIIDCSIFIRFASKLLDWKCFGLFYIYSKYIHRILKKIKNSRAF